MALKSFGRGAMADGSMPPASTPAPSMSSSPGGLTAFIDQGSEFEGKLSFRDTVRIDGRFRGEITSENTLIVGESGEIEAAICSKNVVISGAVEGDVKATQKVMLHKTARVNGDVETPKLVVEDGAVLNGQIRMISADQAGGLKAIDGGGTPPMKPEAKPKPDASSAPEKS